MADAVALLVAAGLVATAGTAAVLLAARRRKASAAERERERLDAPAAAAAEAARTERYVKAVDAAATPADLESLAREFNDKRKF